MSSPPAFSVRSFLRNQEALLVHFNTPMSRNHPTAFPSDLMVAKTLVGQRLSFCTIQKDDRGPWQGGNPADANAAGSVGLIVDVRDVGSVVTVDWNDSGTGDAGSAGSSPSQQRCTESIVKRTASNEWWVQDYSPLGIFIFLPAKVFVKRGSEQGERDASLVEVLTAFPGDRVFSVYGGSFVEFDRLASQWVPVRYSDIVLN